MAESGWHRRDMLAAAGLLALVVGVPVAVVMQSTSLDEALPSDRQRALIAAVSEHVLPTTGTQGAGKVGVGDFVILALAHGLDATRAPAATAELSYADTGFTRLDRSLRYLDWLERTLDRAAKGDWLSKAPSARAQILAALDAAAYAQGADTHPWRKLKGLILTGYYHLRNRRLARTQL